MRVSFRGAACGCALLLPVFLLSGTAPAAIMTFFDVGVSTQGTPLQVSATLATAADAGGPDNALTITLRSYGAATRHPADVLSSFYFTLVDPATGSPVQLTYLSGTGAAYELHTGPANDIPVSWTPQTWTPDSTTPSNLVATNDYDEGWQFRMFTPPADFPFLAFGIGTVGNSDIASFFPGADTTFDGKVVRGVDPGSMINLGIYSVGDGTDLEDATGLEGHSLVRGEAVFRFMSLTSLASASRAWTGETVAFGFGTNPELVLLPEPGSLTMVAVAGLVGLVGLARRRLRRKPAEKRPAA